MSIAAHVGDGQADDADIFQSVLDLIELDGPDDGFNFLHITSQYGTSYMVAVKTVSTQQTDNLRRSLNHVGNAVHVSNCTRRISPTLDQQASDTRTSHLVNRNPQRGNAIVIILVRSYPLLIQARRMSHSTVSFPDRHQVKRRPRAKGRHIPALMAKAALPSQIGDFTIVRVAC